MILYASSLEDIAKALDALADMNAGFGLKARYPISVNFYSGVESAYRRSASIIRKTHIEPKRTPTVPLAVDPKCLALAEYFLAERPDDSPAQRLALAEAFQAVADDWTQADAAPTGFDDRELDDDAADHQQRIRQERDHG